MLHRWNKILGMTVLAVATAGYAQANAPGPHHDFGGRLHIGSLSVGATGQFSTVFHSEGLHTGPSGYGLFQSTAADQLTTNSLGGLVSMQMHPFTWAGVQVNYGFTHYQERYPVSLTAGSFSQPQLVRVPTDAHEATAGYLIHPKHIPFQPYMTVGGGAIDFNPRGGPLQTSRTMGRYQWRGTGYVEMGFDIPTGSPHIGFRVSGRGLFYRTPDFGSPGIRYSAWRATSEPSISAVYKF